MEIKPLELKGNWKAGLALDYHSVSSTLNEDRQFKTNRTQIGEIVYKLKYQEDETQIKPLAQITADFLKSRKITLYLSAILPVPPSIVIRKFQPVFEIAKEIGKILKMKVDTEYLIKSKPTTEMKDIESFENRVNILKGRFEIKDARYHSKKVLLFDDLYISGATLHVLTELLYEKGKVDSVYVLTITKTRSKK